MLQICASLWRLYLDCLQARLPRCNILVIVLVSFMQLLEPPISNLLRGTRMGNNKWRTHMAHWDARNGCISFPLFGNRATLGSNVVYLLKQLPIFR